MNMPLSVKCILESFEKKGDKIGAIRLTEIGYTIYERHKTIRNPVAVSGL